MTDFDPAAINSRLTKGRLTQAEIFWRTHQPWLVDQGYELRARYKPDWIPSWLRFDLSPEQYEDGQILPYDQVIDAVKIVDNSRVVMKRIKKSSQPNENDMLQFFGTGSRASNSRNHCVPVLDTLYPPSNQSWVIVVMPLLREYDSPRFDTVGEVVECFRQLFEVRFGPQGLAHFGYPAKFLISIQGLHFMHEHRVAHRDICVQNLMIDARDMYPKGYHFVRKNKTASLKGRAQCHTRTQRPAKYYIAGYEQAQNYRPIDEWNEKLDPMVPCLTTPTSRFHSDSEASPDPFATDVFYIGNLIRYYFLDGHTSPQLPQRKRRGKLEFLRPLIKAMVQEDYTKRPTMAQVVRIFEGLVQGLSEYTLRSRFSRPQDGVLATAFYGIPHWFRKITFVVRRVPAIPTPEVIKVLKQDKGATVKPISVSLTPSSVRSKPFRK